MGNKSKKNKGHKHGAIVKPKRRVSLDTKLHSIYSMEDLKTVCCRQCTCCRVACPTMKKCEATSIIDKIWSSWNKDDKKKLLATCVKYFFSDSLIKPCPLLRGSECRVYDDRPIACRIYGLWPETSWKKRVEMFSKSTGLQKHQLPLNFQCTNVKRAKGLPDLTDEQIQLMFDALDGLDMVMGATDLQVKSSWNFRTIHDWIIWTFWGEDFLVQWTSLLLSMNAEQRASVVEAFLQQVDKMDIGPRK